MNQFLLAAKIWLRALLILSIAYAAGVATIAIITGNAFSGEFIGLAYGISMVGSVTAYLAFASSLFAVKAVRNKEAAVALAALLAAASAGLFAWIATIMVLDGHPIGPDGELLLFPAAAVVVAVASAISYHRSIASFIRRQNLPESGIAEQPAANS